MKVQYICYALMAATVSAAPLPTVHHFSHSGHAAMSRIGNHQNRDPEARGFNRQQGQRHPHHAYRELRTEEDLIALDDPPVDATSGYGPFGNGPHGGSGNPGEGNLGDASSRLGEYSPFGNGPHGGSGNPGEGNIGDASSRLGEYSPFGNGPHGGSGNPDEEDTGDALGETRLPEEDFTAMGGTEIPGYPETATSGYSPFGNGPHGGNGNPGEGNIGDASSRRGDFSPFGNGPHGFQRTKHARHGDGGITHGGLGRFEDIVAGPEEIAGVPPLAEEVDKLFESKQRNSGGQPDYDSDMGLVSQGSFSEDSDFED